MENIPNILLIDDDESTYKIIEAHLADEKYTLHFFNTGVKAIEHIDRINPDVILLDIMMPEIDGYQVCKSIKENELYSHVPIIMVTAMHDHDEMINAFEFGADDFLTKPFKPRELKARIRSMVRIKQQYEVLESRNSQLEDMIHMCVHDMRNPLQSIFFNIRFIDHDSGLSDKGRIFLQRVFKKVKQLNHYVNDLLYLLKKDHVAINLDKEDIACLELLQPIIDEYKLMSEKKSIIFNVIQDIPDDYTINADFYNLSRVIENLLQNALKYTSKRKTITLKITRDTPGHCIISVSDEGPGIPQDLHEIIFDRYKTSTLRKKGVSQLGLSLAFCKLIIDEHQGEIFVENNQSGGTTITIKI